MSRYSPRFSRNDGRVVAEGMDRLASALAYRQDRDRQERIDAQVEEDRGLSRALTEAQLYGAGVRRGEAPQRESRLFESPTIQRSPLAMGLESAPRPERPPAEPELVAPPGALIPGVGFTQQALFRNPRLGLQDQGPVMEADPRYRQLTEDRYIDTDATPQARAEEERRYELALALEEEARARRRELEDDERGHRYDMTEIEARGEQDRETVRLRAQLDPPGSQEPPTIRLRGRTFPDTPEGQQEALAWEAQFDTREGGDPAMQERRKGILELAGRPPTTELEQTAVNLLAGGSYQYVEDVADRMWELGYPEEEIAAVEAYLRHPQFRRPDGNR